MIYTVSQKTFPPLTSYDLDIHNPITIIFGRSVTEKVRNQTMLCFPTSPILCFCITLQNRKPRRLCTVVLYVQHSPTAAALLTSFLLSHAPNSPEMNALFTRFRKSYSSMSMSGESKKIQEIKQLVEFRQCSNTAFEWKCNLRVSRILSDSAEKHKLFEVA